MVAYDLFHCNELYSRGWFKRSDFWFVAMSKVKGSLEFLVIFMCEQMYVYNSMVSI